MTRAQREWISEQVYRAKEAERRARGDFPNKSTRTQLQQIKRHCAWAAQCGLGKSEGLDTAQYGVVDMSLILTEVVVSQICTYIKLTKSHSLNIGSYAQTLGCVWFSSTLWTVARQAPLSVGFSRQEYWSELPFPPLGDLADPGIEPGSLMSSALAGRFFIAGVTWEAHSWLRHAYFPSGHVWM